MTNVGVFADARPADLALEAIVAAIRDAGVRPAEIEALVNTPVGYMADSPRFAVQRMAEYLEIPTRTMCEVDCGGASSLVGLRYVAGEIASGRIEVGLIYASHWELTTARMTERHADEKNLIR